MNHAWMLDVLEDIRRYAVNERLLRLLPYIENAQIAAERELGSPSDGTNAHRVFRKEA